MSVAMSGGDAVGLVFYPPSPRAVTIEQAQGIVAALPPFVSVVALFVNPTLAQVTEVVTSLAVDLLQFHGDETAEFASSFGLPYIKSVPMGELSVEKSTNVLAAHPSAQGFLCDYFDPDAIGGTGKTFDWQTIPAIEGKALILAGGLHADNVAAAINTVRPYAVDISSGVESAKGVKCAGKIKAFCAAVRAADAQLA